MARVQGPDQSFASLSSFFFMYIFVCLFSQWLIDWLIDLILRLIDWLIDLILGLCWIFTAALGFSLAMTSDGYCLVWCLGFSRCRLQTLGMRASVVVAHGLISCGSQTLEHGLSCSPACGTFLEQRTEPISPALASGFLTIGPPGKSHMFLKYRL